MATTLTISNVQSLLSWSYETTQDWGNNTSQAGSFNFQDTLANGTAADQADKIYIAQTTIAAGGTTNLDLAGSLTDVFGNVITFARIKAIAFKLLTTTAASSVSIGGGTNPFINWVGAGTDTVRVLNGGCFLLFTPTATAYAVTAGTGDVLKLVNNDGSNIATYQIVLVGCTA